MYFSQPIRYIAKLTEAVIDEVNQKILKLESTGLYNFKLAEWERLDSYGLENPPKLESLIGDNVVKNVMNLFPGELLFGWSFSKLPPGKKIIEHTDRMFFHRFTRRIVIPIGNTVDVINWSYKADKTKLYYLLEAGNVYQLNTAITHGSSNNGNLHRRAIYFDVISNRLYDKFSKHSDIFRVILHQNTGVIHVLQ